MWKIMTYQELLKYIYERHSGNVKLGLDRMLSILYAMDNPNLKLRGIHVAGTNGKGSTCAMLEALCLETGQKTGLNTSPHLIDYRERIRIDGLNICVEDLIRLYQQWQQVFEENEASFFEITTAIAFAHFWEIKVETAIFEVGLGGRLDGTNPFAAQVAAITSISFDHVRSLGNSLPKIAWEKSGIIKPHQKVVLGTVPEAALNVIKKTCEEKKADLLQLGIDFRISNIRLYEKITTFDYTDENVTIKDLSVNLSGKHQAYNGGVAVRSFIEWQHANETDLNETVIRKGLQNVNWIGRMQVIHEHPTVLIDGAHNEEGINLLVKSISEIYSDRRLLVVLAILRDKKLEQMISQISNLANKLIISKNKSKRAAEIEDQVRFAEKYSSDYETSKDVVTATRRALEQANPEDVIIITGSLYTISEVLAEGIF